MCATCGCSTGAKATVVGEHPHDHGHDHDHDHDHAHSHDHAHAHSHDHPHEHGHHHHENENENPNPNQNQTQPTPRPTTTVDLEARVLAKNDALAARNRAWFAGREILALNLVSSPGSGKTTLLERTIRDLGKELPLAVIEGDQETSNDADRIRAAGAPAVQVNTGTGCHLEADMVARGLAELKPAARTVLMIENVGNLVCPAMFDLGERAKVIVLSVTEGEDKPLKYPHLFRAAAVMVLNKIDLLPHLDFDVQAAVRNARMVNPQIQVFQLSAKSGEGLAAWYAWIRGQALLAKEAVA